MAKRLDQTIFSRLLSEYESLVTKKEKGVFLKRLSDTYGISRDLFYRQKKEIIGTISPIRKDKGKPRKREAESFLDDIRKIASISMAASINPKNDFAFFRNKKFNPTELSIEIAYSMGMIPEKYPVSTVNYWLKKLGLNSNAFFRDLAAIHVRANHSNHVWLIDATTSESIYIRDDNKLEYDPSLARDKNHFEERLRKKKLRKVWIYFLTDKFSGAFISKAFAGVGLGESGEHYFELLKLAMKKNPDHRIPFHGVPLNLYGDKGAIDKKILHNLYYYFDVNAVWHLPGNSKASGSVESKVSSHKRRIETLFNTVVDYSAHELSGSRLENFSDFINEWTIQLNIQRGFFERYRLGLKNAEEVSDDHFLLAMLGEEIRTVDNFGDIEIDNTIYHVTSDINNTKVRINRKYPDIVYATDYLDRVHECSKDLKETVFGSYNSHTKTETVRERDYVKNMAINFKTKHRQSDIMPSKIYPLRSDAIDIFSVEKSWERLLSILNLPDEYFDEPTKEMCHNFFKTILEQDGHISEDTLQKFAVRIEIHIHKKQENTI